MKWYYILLIVIGCVLLLAILTFTTIYLISLKQKKAMKLKANDYCMNVIMAVGGINNIVEVMLQSSRLSFVLKDMTLLNENALNGVGILKSSKKITLVIGEYAKQYYEDISKQLHQ